MSVSWAKLRRLESEVEAATAAADRPDFERFRDDPAAFNRDVLGRSLYDRQIAVCDAVARSPVTLIPAAKSVGKSHVLAGLALWWLYTRAGSRVITTGPDFRQICTVLWGEMRRAIVGAKEPLRFEYFSRGFGSPQRLVVSQATRWEAIGYAANTTEGFSGQHAGDLLVIVDEASGITAPIWSAIHGLNATRLVVAGNPIRYDCHFRELFELAASTETIAVVPISALDSPHASEDHSPVGLVSRTFLNQMRAIHGEESPWWRSNILGLFPGQESVQFIQTSWIDACLDHSVLEDDSWLDHAEGPRRLAVDVAGGVGADRSVVIVRNDKQLLEVFASREHGVLEDARHRLEPVVIEMAQKWGVYPSRVTFDAAGLGRSFGSYLAALGFDGAIGYYGAGRGGRYYVNRRSANAFALKNRLDPRREDYVQFYCGGIPEWPSLRQELIALHDAPMELQEGKVKQAIESKEVLSARLKRSPDLADALIQSFTFHLD
jgi:hypothetical protein